MSLDESIYFTKMDKPNSKNITALQNLEHMKYVGRFGCAGGKIEKNEMGGACGTYGGGERCAQGSGGETGGKDTTGETQT